MANVRSIRQALADQLQTKLNIRTLPKMPPVITPPTIMVLGGSPYIRYGATEGEIGDALQTLGGSDALDPIAANDIMLTILICISVAQGYEAMQDTLDDLLEPAGNVGSIPNVLAQDTTLGGVVSFAVPLDCSGGNLINVAGQDYFGANMRVQIGA